MTKPSESPAQISVPPANVEPPRSVASPTSDDSTAHRPAPPAVEKPLGFWPRLSFGLVHAATAVLLRIIGLRGLYLFGRLFGTIEWLINFKRRRRFLAAFERVIGRRGTLRERLSGSREFFCQSRCDKMLYLIFDCLPHDRAVALATMENRELLDASLAQGRGVYVALSHFGPHHVAATFMALMGYKMAGVRDRNEGAMRRYMQQRWDKVHPDLPQMRVIYADTFPREIFRCFKDGYLVGSAMDVSRVRAAHQKMEEVVVFGEARAFISGPLRIALRCKAPIVQGFITPRRNFQYHMEVLGPLLDPNLPMDEDAAVAQAMRVYAETVERYVRANPALLTRL